MTQTIFILGKKGTGKALLAQKIAGEKKFYETSEFQSMRLSTIEPDTEILIINTEGYSREMKLIKQLISSRNISYRKPYSASWIEFPRPAVIVTSHELTEKDLGDFGKSIIITIKEKQ